MTHFPLAILYEDNHCLAVAKPEKMLTVGDKTDDISLAEHARRYIKKKYKKPGDVFLGIVHRLDRPASGVVLFARTSKAAARLSEQFRAHTVRKVYRAIVEGKVASAEGECEDWLLKDRAANITKCVSQEIPDSRRALLKYRRLQTGSNRTLLEVLLVTGRSHQIRVQLASRGHPICGDQKYGSSTRMGGAIALHAAQLTFTHPTKQETIVLTAPTPHSWSQFI